MSTKHGGRGGAIVNLSLGGGAAGLARPVRRLRRRQGRDRHLHASAWPRKWPPRASASTRCGPGIIETDIHASGGLPDRAQQMAPLVPMQRAGSADEVAQAIVWLLSDAASYTTGAIARRDRRALTRSRPRREETPPPRRIPYTAPARRRPARPSTTRRDHDPNDRPDHDRGSAALLAACASAPKNPMSFFVTSVGPRQGRRPRRPGRCRRALREAGRAVGAGGKNWRAYLSTTGAGGVNARDRIGEGPWQQRQGRGRSPATWPRCTATTT